MKTGLFLIVFLSLFVGVTGVYSQNRRDAQPVKPLNNPFYSSSNYKHPQAAAAARSWESKPAVGVSRPVSTETQLVNYKHQMPNKKPVGGVVIPHTPSTNLADRNYKIQRLSVPQRSADPREYYVEQVAKAAKDTLID
ncbi:hypothetical protein [Spirosoma luteum]|uniref:hypothetical protein n=1 Tax=Spirosoma luteum TaxID=431553 RepID=UPI00037A5EC3|nr:hypothetical protein [Spirosoma luteum]